MRLIIDSRTTAAQRRSGKTARLHCGTIDAPEQLACRSAECPWGQLRKTLEHATSQSLPDEGFETHR